MKLLPAQKKIIKDMISYARLYDNKTGRQQNTLQYSSLQNMT